MNVKVICPFCKRKHDDYWLVYRVGNVVERDPLVYVPDEYGEVLEIECKRCGEAWVPPCNGELKEHEYAHDLEWRRRYHDAALPKPARRQ